MKHKLFTRNFTLLILGQVSSLIGNYTLKFALSMYVLERTGSAAVFAGILALSMIPMIFLSPFGGILADRANRRNIMVALDSLSGVAVLITGFLVSRLTAVASAVTAGQDIWCIGALLILLSVLGAFESPTVQACIPQMLSGDNIMKGNAAVNQIASIAALVTPFLGSLFYAAFGIGPVFYGAVICFFVTAFFECFIRLDHKKQEESMGIREIIKEDFSASAKFLRRERPEILKLLLLASVVSFFVAGTAVVGFPYLVRTVLGLSATHYGIAESAMGIASILGSLCVVLLAKKISMRHLALVFVVFGISLIPCGLIFLVPVNVLGRYGTLLAMFCICQLGCSFFSTYAISMIQERTPEHLMGKVMSYVFTLSMCAQPMGQILYGAWFDRCSDRVYWVLIPSGIAVCAIGVLSREFFVKLERR